MAVMRCSKCSELCFPDADCNPASMCEACGGTELVCDHPGSHFDVENQCFVCSWCGEQDHKGLPALRRFARSMPGLDIGEVIDLTDH